MSTARRCGYIEVTNAEHFGTDLPGFDTRMVPLTIYHLRGLDALWNHLTSGAPLPESQVVRTTVRGGEPRHAPPLGSANVPPLPLQPNPADRISRAERGRVFNSRLGHMPAGRADIKTFGHFAQPRRFNGLRVP